MKKLIIFAVSFLLLINYINPIRIYAKEKPPSVSADSAVLLDANTGKILFSKNPDSAYPPASTTKIMTALLVLEKGDLDSYVTVGKNPPKVDGTRLGLIEGEKLKVRDLLYGLLLASDNDCAEALAEHVGGSLNKFVEKMNKRAVELGASHTHFANPSGLFNKNHKVSSRDLALMMEKLSENPEYSKIATTLSYTIKPTNKSSSPRTVWNENRLVQKQSHYYYEGSLGGKTGYTVQSLHSYVAAATRGGHKLIVALIHDKNKTFFPDTISLFNYGFNNFKLEKLYSKGELVTTYTKDDLSIPLIAESDFYYTKSIDDKSVPVFNLSDKKLDSKSFKAGEPVEEAVISFNGSNIGSLKLLSGVDHNSKTLFNQHSSQLLHMENTQYTVIIISLIVLIGITIIVIKKYISI
ncbi:serine hydrolase [Clostridium sp. LBM24168]